MSTETTLNKVLIKDELTKLTYGQSFRQWLERKPLSYYESQVLSYEPFYPDLDATRESKLINTVIDTKGNYIHEFYIQNTEPTSEERHIVIVHGYGASLGFFYQNFDTLSQIKGVKIHAIDLLGFGLSSRPKFPKIDVHTEEDITKCENFFVDSLEEWRKRRNLKDFVLIGHSLGGYLSSCYTLKYQENVSKLILVSPVGVERSDYSLIGNSTNLIDKPDNRELESGPEIADELYESPEPTQSHKTGGAKRTRNLPPIFVKLWERHTSPFSIVRGVGPLGPKFISGWSFSRLGGPGVSNEQIMNLHKYAFNTFVAKGSGEYSLTRILAPGALARLPLLDRLPGVIKVPSLWIYGDRDWMDRDAGKECCDDINAMSRGKLLDYKVVSNAGHHIYLDNPIDFDHIVKRFINWN